MTEGHNQRVASRPAQSDPAAESPSRAELLAPMSEGDAQKYLDNPYDEASFALKGDDPSQDRVLTDEFYVDIRLHYISTGSAQTVETCRLSLRQ
jgi:hypothetical protein